MGACRRAPPPVYKGEQLGGIRRKSSTRNTGTAVQSAGQRRRFLFACRRGQEGLVPGSFTTHHLSCSLSPSLPPSLPCGCSSGSGLAKGCATPSTKRLDSCAFREGITAARAIAEFFSSVECFVWCCRSSLLPLYPTPTPTPPVSEPNTLGCVSPVIPEDVLLGTPFESHDLYRGQSLGAIGGVSTLKKVRDRRVLCIGGAVSADVCSRVVFACVGVWVQFQVCLQAGIGWTTVSN